MWKQGRGIVYPPVNCEEEQVQNEIKAAECHFSTIWFPDEWFLQHLTNQILEFQVFAETLLTLPHGKCWELQQVSLHKLSIIDSRQVLAIDTRCRWCKRNCYETPQSYFLSPVVLSAVLIGCFSVTEVALKPHILYFISKNDSNEFFIKLVTR